jgi:hypothetical protein
MRGWCAFHGACSKSCFQKAASQNGASKPTNLHRTRFELIAERKVRRRQLTDDGNVEITGRDLREREVRARHPRPSVIAGPLHDSRTKSCSGCRAPVSGQGEDRGSA